MHPGQVLSETGVEFTLRPFLLSLCNEKFDFPFKALKDEQQTLQLLCNQLETTLRKVQEENTELITRWMQEKAKHADEVNKGNELIHGILDEKHKKEQQKEER